MLPLKLVDNSFLAALMASGGWLFTWPSLGAALYIQSLSPPSFFVLQCLKFNVYVFLCDKKFPCIHIPSTNIQAKQP